MIEERYEPLAVCFDYTISPKLDGNLPGGVLVILKFIQLLNARGIKSALFFAGEAPETDIVPLTNAISYETVVVYSEGVHGNPLSAKRVCRWMLYDPYKRGGQELIDTWNENDVLCSYGNYDCGLQCNISVNVVDFNEDKFTINNRDKPKKYYLIHKALMCGWTCDALDSEITKLREEEGFEEFQMAQPEKMNIMMQECSVFVSFDLNTYISNIAVLCGALSMVRKSDTNTLSYTDILEKRGSYGSIGIKPFDFERMHQPYDYDERLNESNMYREYIKTANNIDEFIKYYHL